MEDESKLPCRNCLWFDNSKSWYFTPQCKLVHEIINKLKLRQIDSCPEYIEIKTFEDIKNEAKERIDLSLYNREREEIWKDCCKLMRCETSRSLIDGISNSLIFFNIFHEEYKLTFKEFLLVIEKAKENITIMETNAYKQNKAYISKRLIVACSLLLAFLQNSIPVTQGNISSLFSTTSISPKIYEFYYNSENYSQLKILSEEARLTRKYILNSRNTSKLK